MSYRKPTDNLDVAVHMQSHAEGDYALEQLVFDPRTGELVLAKPGDALPPDGVVIDEIAEEGFFAEAAGPTAVVHLGAADALEGVVEATRFAFAHDDAMVVHVHLDDAPHKPSGTPIPCRLLCIGAFELAPALSAARRELEAASAGKEGSALVVLLRRSGDLVEVGALLARAGVVEHCEVMGVPRRSELFSRARGLLETDLLAHKRVAVVGLGSGGSPVAVDLARSGVGSFVLIDPDRLELANVSRHVCGVSDLGRLKVNAVRDAIHERNPHAEVLTHAVDVNADPAATLELLRDADLIIAATDGPRSRTNLNAAALELGIPALFGRALTRAAGGDVLRVRPGQGPCLACVFAAGGLKSEDEEVSSLTQAVRDAPAYALPGDLGARVHPGLTTDIAPIANMMARLALLELSRGTSAGIAATDGDLAADFYIWANRRERTYAGWQAMGFRADRLSVLRWYGVRTSRLPGCMQCGESVAGARAVFEDYPGSAQARSGARA